MAADTFPWRAGMLAVLNTGIARGQVLRVRPDGRLDVWCAVPAQRQARVVWSPDTCHPDPEDGATLGALLQALQERLDAQGLPQAGDVYLQPQTNGPGWVVFRRGRPTDTCGGLGGPPKWKPLAVADSALAALLEAWAVARA